MNKLARLFATTTAPQTIHPHPITHTRVPCHPHSAVHRHTCSLQANSAALSPIVPFATNPTAHTPQRNCRKEKKNFFFPYLVALALSHRYLGGFRGCLPLFGCCPNRDLLPLLFFLSESSLAGRPPRSFVRPRRPRKRYERRDWRCAEHGNARNSPAAGSWGRKFAALARMAAPADASGSAGGAEETQSSEVGWRGEAGEFAPAWEEEVPLSKSNVKVVLLDIGR